MRIPATRTTSGSIPRGALEIARLKVAEICTGEMRLAIPADRARAVDQVVREAQRALLGRETGLLP